MDRKDIQALQNGHWESGQAILQRYQPLCFSLLKKYGGEEIEDLRSQIKLFFIELCLEYDLNSSIPVAGYIKSKLEKRLYNYLRKIWKRKELLCADLFYRQEKKYKIIPQKQLIKWHLLNKQQKSVLFMVYYYGYTEREVAKAMGLSPSRINKVKKTALLCLKNGEQT